MNVTSYGAGVFTVEDFLSDQECEQYIQYSESKGFDEAAITTDTGQEIFKEIRNNDRIIFDDETLSKTLFERAKEVLPVIIDDYALIGFNERFRFYRYERAQYFKWHKDGSYERSESERSLLTFLIYLNDGYSGGETAFRWDKVLPKKGSALVFPHTLLHQGNEIVGGVKYVLRTDVMYRIIV